MAKTIKSIAKGTKGYKSWKEYGTDIGVNDRLTGLVLDVSSTKDEESATITLNGSDSSSVSVIAGGVVSNASADLVANKVVVNNVDATTIYGGAVLTTKTLDKITASNDLGATTRWIDDTAVTVSGDVDLTIKGATVSTVYGAGAGYGSVLEGDVNLTFKSTNRIGTVYGGGQKGAVVAGDVNIVIDRTDATVGGRIGTVYGGGNNAVVEGDVNITVTGANAISMGTISGSGKGYKSRVEGERTLTLNDYSGKFSATIKDFDKIVFSGSSAVTLTQSQNASIKSAEYEFVINEAAFGQSADAMLTWSNSSVNTGNFYVTIDVDDDYVANGFEGKKIYYSSYLTAKSAANISVRALEADGSYSDIDSSAYSLTFVADTDTKGNAKAKGGYVVLDYTGSKISVTADTAEDLVLTSAADRVTVKAASDREIVTANIDTGAGNDRVTVQGGAINKGEVALGTGTNVLTVQGDAEQVGSILVSENSKNTININGTISAIEGGDSTTDNTININSENAIGYWKYGQGATVSGTFESDSASTGSGSTSSTEGASGSFVVTPGEQQSRFYQQDLNLGASNDTVVVSTFSAYAGNINLGEGKDTLILNTTTTGTITSDDGNDIIVANKSGVDIDTAAYRLTGTDNALVIANGVTANVTGIAMGDFANLESDTFSRGIYLGQNAIFYAGGNTAVSSYNGGLDLGGTLTVLAKDQLDATADAELIARIGKYYTAGTGVNGDIAAKGNAIILKEGAVVNSKISNAVVHAVGSASGTMTFENATLTVDEDKVLTVKSIEGLDVTQNLGSDVARAEADLAKINLSDDAQVYATADKLTVAGPITKDTAFVDNVAFKGTVDKGVTVALNAANAYLAAGADLNNANIAFTGANEVVLNQNLTLDNKKVSFAEGAEVKFDVLDDKTLTINGIVNGETYNAAIKEVALGTNAKFAYADNIETASWNKKFTAAENQKNIAIREGSTFTDGIQLGGTQNTIIVGDGSEIKNKVAGTAITLGGGLNELAIGNSQVYGQIVSNGTTGGLAADEYDNVITLTGTKVDAVDGTAAVALTGANDKLVAKDAVINGDLTGGKLVQLNGVEVTGQVTGTVEAVSSTIGEVAGGRTTVLGVNESGIPVLNATTIGKFTNGTLVADGGEAKIGEIAADNANTVTLRVKDGGSVDKMITMNADTGAATLEVVNAEVGQLAQISDGAKVVRFNADTDNDPATANVFADKAVVGEIVQREVTETVASTATVNANLRVVANYGAPSNTEVTGPELADVVDPIVKEALVSKTGAVAQETDQNTFSGTVTLRGNGTYERAAVGSNNNNNAKHKDAIVNVGAATAEYGDVKQIGDTSNTLTAGLDYQAHGEADVTVGKSTLTMGQVSQYSEGGTNTATISLNAAADTQAILTLNGGLKAEVGAVSQTAFRNNNTLNVSTAFASELDQKIAFGTALTGREGKIIGDDITLAITVASIDMLAYGGDNDLDLTGNVTVKGDVNVGGVYVATDTEKHIGENASWGDRTATLNDVDITVDTVKIEGNLTLIGLTNQLDLTNASGTIVEGGYSAAKNVYLAGDNNTVTIGVGVNTDNIHFYRLTDWDKIGVEGYDLGSGTYTNGVTINGGTAKEIIVENPTSNDTISVNGGTVTGDIVTKNSDAGNSDTVNVTAVAATKPGDTVVLGRDATVGGSVTMGGADNEGMNVLYVAGTEAVIDDVTYANAAKIGGNVTMTSKVSNTVTADKATIVGATAMDSLNNGVAVQDKSSFGAISQTAKMAETATAAEKLAQQTTVNDITSLTATTAKDTMGDLTQVADIAETAAEIEAGTFYGANNRIVLKVADTKGIAQTADGTNTLSMTGVVLPQDTPAKVEDQYADPVKNFGSVTGDITQTSTKDDAATNNTAIFADTDVTGKITQTAIGQNYLTFSGDVTTGIKFKDVNWETTVDDETYSAVNAATITGSIEQTGSSNQAILSEASVTGATTQNATSQNFFFVMSQMTAAAVKDETLDAEKEACTFGGGDGKDHNAESVYIEAKYNKQSVGDITQTVTLPQGGTPSNNVILAQNADVGAVSQTYADGQNSLTVSVVDRLEQKETYDYEILDDTDHSVVKKAETYYETETRAVKSVNQTGDTNSVNFTSVNSGAVVQAAKEGNNTISTQTIADATAVVVDKMSWEDNAEVTKKAILEGSANTRAGNTLASVAQTSDWGRPADDSSDGSQWYDNQKVNGVYLTNTTVTGAVSQTATATTAGKTAGNVKNSLTTTTNDQHLVGFYTDEADPNKTQTVYDYTTTVIDTIGSVAQSGYENYAHLTKTSVTGAVEQTATVIATYDHTNIDQQKFAISANKFNASGAAAEDGIVLHKDTPEEQVVIAAKDNDITIGSITQTLDGTKLDKNMVDGAETIGNDVNLSYANVTSIAQNATSAVNNTVYAERSSIGTITATNTQQTWKVGEVDHTTEANSTVRLYSSAVASITTSTGADSVEIGTLAADETSTIGSIDTGAANDAITLAGKTTVTGTIDMGTGTADVLNTTKDVDLKSATLTGVEVVNYDALGTATVLEVSKIEGDKVSMTGLYGDTLKVTTLDVEMIAGSAAKHLVSKDDTTAINYTADNFGKGDSWVSSISGASKSKEDKLTIGDGTGEDILKDVAVTDVETVEFKAGAKSTALTSWSDSDATDNDKISFTIADLGKTVDDAKDAEKNSFVIGNVTYATDKVTVNGYTWHAHVQWGATDAERGCWCDSSIATDSTAQLKTNQTYYRYDGTESYNLGVGLAAV